MVSRGPTPWRVCELVLCGIFTVLEYICMSELRSSNSVIWVAAHTGRALSYSYLKSTFRNMEMNNRIRANHQTFFFT